MNNKEIKGYSFNKTSFFLRMLFLKNEVQLNKNNYGVMVFISKQVCPPKTGSTSRNENQPEKQYTPFLHLSKSITCIVFYYTSDSL